MSICIVIIVAVLGFYWYQANKDTIKKANTTQTEPQKVEIPNMPQNTSGGQYGPQGNRPSGLAGSTGISPFGEVTSTSGSARDPRFMKPGPLGPAGPLGPGGAMGPAGPN